MYLGFNIIANCESIQIINDISQSFKPAVSQSEPGTSQVEKSVLSPSAVQFKLKENEKDQVLQNVSGLPRISLGQT